MADEFKNDYYDRLILEKPIFWSERIVWVYYLLPEQDNPSCTYTCLFLSYASLEKMFCIR